MFFGSNLFIFKEMFHPNVLKASFWNVHNNTKANLWQLKKFGWTNRATNASRAAPAKAPATRFSAFPTRCRSRKASTIPSMKTTSRLRRKAARLRSSSTNNLFPSLLLAGGFRVARFLIGEQKVQQADILNAPFV